MSKKSVLILVAVTLGVAIPVCVLALAASAFDGKPTYSAGCATGAWIWSEENGLHLRVTTKDGAHVFKGKICANEITDMDYYHVADVSSNSVTLSGDHKCAHFDLQVNQTLVGFNFNARGQKVEFSIQMDEQNLPPQKIWIGGHGVNPPSNPFTLDR